MRLSQNSTWQFTQNSNFHFIEVYSPDILCRITLRVLSSAVAFMWHAALRKACISNLHMPSASCEGNIRYQQKCCWPCSFSYPASAVPMFQQGSHLLLIGWGGGGTTRHSVLPLNAIPQPKNQQREWISTQKMSHNTNTPNWLRRISLVMQASTRNIISPPKVLPQNKHNFLVKERQLSEDQTQAS